MNSRTYLGITYRRRSHIAIMILLVLGLLFFYLGSPSLPAGPYSWWAFTFVVVALALVVAALIRDGRER